MSSWEQDPLPTGTPPGVAGSALIILRLLLLVITIYGLLVLLWLVRLFEWPWGRVVSPYITQLACRFSLRILGIKLVTTGKPMGNPGAVVSNHVSWLDIFVLNAPQRILFVAKSEIASWFGIGVLVRSTGGLFIERKIRAARLQRELFAKRLAEGDKLLFFPEGTSSDGLRVLRFRSSLFAAFFDGQDQGDVRVQPVSLTYRAPRGEDPRFYGWWADMTMVEHMLRVLGSWRRGEAHVAFHDPLVPDSFPDRKALASRSESIVRAGMRHYPDLKGNQARNG